jgi:hypothetical protein
MTGTEPHAPRGAAGRGPNRDSGPYAELHGAVRSGTTGCRPNRDHGPCAGRGSYASTHAHLGTAGCGTLWEPRAASGPEELHKSERTYVSTHAYLGTAGRGTRKGTVGCERAKRAA